MGGAGMQNTDYFDHKVLVSTVEFCQVTGKSHCIFKQKDGTLWHSNTLLRKNWMGGTEQGFTLGGVSGPHPLYFYLSLLLSICISMLCSCSYLSLGHPVPLPNWTFYSVSCLRANLIYILGSELIIFCLHFQMRKSGSRTLRKPFQDHVNSKQWVQDCPYSVIQRELKSVPLFSLSVILWAQTELPSCWYILSWGQGWVDITLSAYRTALILLGFSKLTRNSPRASIVA